MYVLRFSRCAASSFAGVRRAHAFSPRFYAAAQSSLKNRLAELIPEKQAEIKRIKTEHGNKVLGEVTVEQAYGGARSVKCLITETSLLDPEEGIRLRGLTVFECQEKLPKVRLGAGRRGGRGETPRRSGP